MEKCLINTIYEDSRLDANKPYDQNTRTEGRDWPSVAHSMIGIKRMNQLRSACETAIKENIPGDFIETGVWRGGATIMMRAVLAAYNDTNRNVWVADSFQGVPPPNAAQYPVDTGDEHHTLRFLAISKKQVEENFKKYNLLDSQVQFLEGWFKDTLPKAPLGDIAVLRLDGDIYESTMDSLTCLYDKVPPGGFVIIDDYGVLNACRLAVHDFLNARKLAPTIIDIDGWGRYWRK